jgi:hypothetical protein
MVALSVAVLFACGSESTTSPAGQGGPDNTPTQLSDAGGQVPADPQPAQPTDAGEVVAPPQSAPVEAEEIPANEVADGQADLQVPTPQLGTDSGGATPVADEGAGAGTSGSGSTAEGSEGAGSGQSSESTAGEVAQGGDSGSASETQEEVAGTQDSSSQDIAADSGEGGAAEQDIKGITITLDTSQGKWFTAERKELFSKDEFKAAQNRIKELRDKIKDLRKEYQNLNKALPEQANEKAKGKVAENKAKRQEEIKAEIARYRTEIQQIKTRYGVNRFQDGIWTAWANQVLLVNARVEKAGWYRLRLVAKNIHGPLPDFYSHFNVHVSNETSGKDIGGVSIKATDASNQANGVWVYLERGDNKLKLLWTNDAYKKDVYDANINIRKIALSYHGTQAPRLGMRRNAHQYSYLDGRFFWDANSVWTYWANQCIGFDYSNLKAGRYKVIVQAKNYGVVPREYTNFSVRVNTDDGAEGTISIPANKDQWQRGETVLDITGSTTIYLTWTNDMYKPDRTPVEDANIQYRSIRLQRIGESERSRVAAYLLGTRTGNAVMMVGSIGVLGMVLAGFYWFNRRRSRLSAS